MKKKSKDKRKIILFASTKKDIDPKSRANLWNMFETDHRLSYLTGEFVTTDSQRFSRTYSTRIANTFICKNLIYFSRYTPFVEDQMRPVSNCIDVSGASYISFQIKWCYLLLSWNLFCVYFGNLNNFIKNGFSYFVK